MNKYIVYKHTSPTGKSYIGITNRNPIYRWANGKGYIGQPKFYNAIQKYGWDNIKHEILFSDLNKKEACGKEIELIKKYNSIKNGYNVSTGGECTHSGAYKYKINDIIGNFKVIGRTDVKIKLQCLDCGETLERYPGSLNRNRVKCKCKIKYNPNPKPRKTLMITYKGKTQSVQDWSKELNIPIGTIRSRYKNNQPIDELKKKPKQQCHCEMCNKLYLQKYKTQKYCSKECQIESMKKARPKRICNYCGEEFELKRTISNDYKGEFCSHKCQIDYMRKRA